MSNPTVIRNLPVATFRYKGSHSHPVRRTVLLTEICKENDIVRGYEVREGSEVRSVSDKTIKTFTLSKAKEFDRMSIADAEQAGVLTA